MSQNASGKFVKRDLKEKLNIADAQQLTGPLPEALRYSLSALALQVYRWNLCRKH
jgi:hypothetical protein